jgi:cytidyltransferase-like protein
MAGAYLSSPESRATVKPEYGMIHGRFQPFHNGHLEYLRAARPLCQTLVVGITNPDPTTILEDPSSSHRHLPEANPYSFFERLLMVREVIASEGILSDRALIIPFPVNSPERWRFYLPPDVVHYVRVFSEWERSKVDRLRKHGYRVEVLHPGIEKAIEASEVRRRMAAGEDWRSLLPQPVVRVIERLKETARAS